MGAAVALTLAFVIIEAVCGWFAHSLALLSDAGHNLTDAAALAFSWYALSIAANRRARRVQRLRGVLGSVAPTRTRALHSHAGTAGAVAAAAIVEWIKEVIEFGAHTEHATHSV
jgi:cation efflux family protein